MVREGAPPTTFLDRHRKPYIRLPIGRLSIHSDPRPIVPGHIHEIGKTIRLTQPIADRDVLAKHRRPTQRPHFPRQRLQQHRGVPAHHIRRIRINHAHPPLSRAFQFLRLERILPAHHPSRFENAVS
jgi:hypothetical protein